MMQEEEYSSLEPDGATPVSTLPAKKIEFFSKKGAYIHVKEESETEEKTKMEEFDVEVKEDTTSVRGKLRSVWSKHKVIIAWGIGFCGLLCCAWIGPCFKYLGSLGVTPTRRASWRSQALFFLLLLPSYLEYRTLTPAQKSDLFSMKALKGMLLCGIFWLGDLSFWSNSLEFTTVPRASIFANSYSLMMVLYFKLRRKPISGMETIGAIIGFSGLLAAVVGTQYFGGESATQAGNKVWLGDLLATATAVCCLAYILNAGEARKIVPMFTYTLTNTMFLAIFLSIISIATEKTTFDTTVHGLFGWLQPKYMMVVGTLSVVAGVIGFNFNSFSVKFVPPVAFAIIGLCDPVISGTYAWLLGVDNIPGVFTFVGGAITISGTIILLIGQDRRTKKEKLLESNTSTDSIKDAHDKKGAYTLAVSESSAFTIGEEEEETKDAHTAHVISVGKGGEVEVEEKRGLISDEVDET